MPACAQTIELISLSFLRMYDGNWNMKQLRQIKSISASRPTARNE